MIDKQVPRSSLNDSLDHIEVLNEERGSAIAEFVLVALPLLLPATLFFIAMNQSAKVNMSTALMARQAVTAFISGDDDLHGHARVQVLINEYKRLDPSIVAINYQLSCQTNPCITPGAAVALTLRVQFQTLDVGQSGNMPSGTGRRSYRSEQRAVSFVDKWG